MNAITNTGNVSAIILISGLALWFYWRRQPDQAIFLFVTFEGVMAFNSLLKLVFARPRPQLFPPLVIETDYSFPSGHAMAAVTAPALLTVAAPSVVNAIVTSEPSAVATTSHPAVKRAKPRAAARRGAVATPIFSTTRLPDLLSHGKKKHRVLDDQNS